MNLKRLLLSLPILFLLASCGESDLTEEYMADAAKVIALKITNPEAPPGETVSMRLFVAGKEVDQGMTTPVLWYTEGENSFILGASAYNSDFSFQIPATLLDGKDNVLTIPVFASIKINDKYLKAKKLLRITKNPIGRNPLITGINLRYGSNGISSSNTIHNGGTATIPENTENIAVTAITEKLDGNANDQLIYRWYVSFSKNSEGKLYVYDDKETIEALLGEGAKAADFRESVVYSLKGEENDEDFQTGIYDIYLVVRDNTLNSDSTDEDRLGTDFIFFTITF